MTNAVARQLVADLARHTKELVLTGGDALMRGDICELAELAKSLGVIVEIHTNARLLSAIDGRRLLSCIDHLGLSLDGPNPAVHDKMRNAPGNFAENLGALKLASEMAVPTTVRTLITKRNFTSINEIGPLLLNYACVKQWCLRQFVPLARGARTNSAYNLGYETFRATANASQSAINLLGPQFETLIVREDDIACYCFVGDDGVFFTRSQDSREYLHLGQFPEMSVEQLIQSISCHSTGAPKRDLRCLI